MTLLLIFTGPSTDPFAKAFTKRTPERAIEIWPEHTSKPEDIRYALAWNAPTGIFKQFPNLEILFSLGAGVDHLMRDPDLPACPIVRYVAEDMTQRMTEYVVLHVLLHHRRLLDYQDFQRKKLWKGLRPQPAASDVRVGILGLGELGSDAAQKLTLLGFQTAGWSRSEKKLDGIECFFGASELHVFLARTDILVCLLPHTKDTEGFINRALLRKLARDGVSSGPVLINAGRGPIQVEADILAALEAGELHAATLDVFESEPLAEMSPLWTHPRVVVTPHNAADTDPQHVARYVLDQIARHEGGAAVENVIDRQRGY
ncbi:MAG: 2-hydroxyacid dehydrogenase [Methyloligellaceae bacterium]